MKYSNDTTPLGMPDDFKFGIELEAYNVNTIRQDGLYKGESAKYISEHGWHMASVLEEALVGEGGAELVSPILRDTPEDWQSITDMCEHMQKYPRKTWK